MVDPVDPMTRKSNTYPVQSVQPGRAVPDDAAAARDAAAAGPGAPVPPGSPAAHVPEAPEKPHYDVEIVRRDGSMEGMGIRVVRMLNPSTGQPIYQSPPEGVLVMLENALWRLRTKDS